MTSRERLLAVLNHELPDRVPVCTYELQAANPDSWEHHEPSYQGLLEFLKPRTDTFLMCGFPWYSFAAGQTETEEWQEGARHHTRMIFHSPLGDLVQHTAWEAKVKTVWTLEHMLKTPDDIPKFLALNFEVQPADFSAFKEQQARLGEAGLMLPSLPDPVCIAAEAFEMSDFLLYTYTEPERMLYFLDALGERLLAQLEVSCKAAAEQLGAKFGEVLFRICGPEYVTPPYMSPDRFNRLVTRYVAKMSEVIHSHGAKMRYHCHGRIAEVVDEILATAPDAVDPLEGPPDGDLTLAEAKRRMGKHTCLMGNLQLRLLEFGTTEEVKQAVTECMQAAKEGGGYVIMPTTAPISVPLSPRTEENYKVFVETALELGGYE